jgi:hypothetical protein
MSCVKISVRPSSEGIVLRSERIDGTLVCGVLRLTLMDTDGVAKVGEPGTGTAGGICQRVRTNERLKGRIRTACRGVEGYVGIRDGSVGDSDPTSTRDRGPRTEELIDMLDVAEEVEIVLARDGGVNEGAHDIVGVVTSVGDEMESGNAGDGGNAGIARDSEVGVSGMGVSLYMDDGNDPLGLKLDVSNEVSGS